MRFDGRLGEFPSKSFDLRKPQRPANIEARHRSTSFAKTTNTARLDCTCCDKEDSRPSGSRVQTNQQTQPFVSKTGCDSLSSSGHYPDRSPVVGDLDVLISLFPTKLSSSRPKSHWFRGCQKREIAFQLPSRGFQAAPICSLRVDRDPSPSPPYRFGRCVFFPP